MNRCKIWYWSGFFLLSFSVLYLEVLVTRIFSYIIWHNIAYLVISLAMLGIGAGGVWDSIRPSRIKPLNHGWHALFASLVIFLGFKLLDSLDFKWGLAGWFYFLYSSLLVFAPFFFLGLVLVRVFAVHASEIGKAYALNMLASGAGAMAALLILAPLGMPRAVFIACLALGSAGLLFAVSSGRALKLISVLWMIFIASGLSWGNYWFLFKTSSTKPLGKYARLWPKHKIEYSRWDPIGKIDVISSPESYIKIDNESLFYRIITNDGAAETPIIDLESTLETSHFFRGTYFGLAYSYYGKPPQKVLVIALGGGPDVLTALHFQARNISGVEINGTTFRVLQKYKPWLFQDSKIRLFKGDGRNYVERSREQYDIITASGVDTVSALEWGAYLQAENYIHTVEAYQQYLRHLAPGGVVFIELIELHPPRYMLRACANMVEALRREGISHPERNIILVQQAQVIGMIAQKEPIDPARLQEYIRRMEAGNSRQPMTYAEMSVFNKKIPLQVRYAPGMGNEKDQFVRYFAAVAQGSERGFFSGYVYNVSPTTDDRPFFYHVFRMRLSRSLDKMAGNFVLFQLMESIFFAGLFMLLPLYALGRKHVQRMKGKIWFFLLIGLGYMLIEIPFIQHFVLYLGHPVYALVQVLVVLLVGSGVGAWIFNSWLKQRRWALWAAVITIIVWSFLGLKLMPLLLSQVLPAGLAGTISLTTVFTFILGVAMGIPFPAGIHALAKNSGNLVPWAWATNISASVVSSILAVIIAMNQGFRVVSLAACLCYLLAAAVFNLLDKD